MKITGVGVDITKNSRIKNMLKNRQFINRVFSKDEINSSRKKFDKTSFFAKRFAAKEAFSKSLGTGISKGIKFNEIEVFNNKYGKPQIRILGDSLKIVKNIIKSSFRVFLSLSDESHCAVAFVIIEKK